jgi:hypothetical protein
MTIQERIKQAATIDGDEFDLAEQIITQCTKAELVPYIAEAILQERRTSVRSTEKAWFAEMVAAFSPSRPLVEQRIAQAAEFSQLLRSRFAIGDGRHISWAEATIEEHEQRIAMLQQMRSGITETIKRHEQAVKLLRQTGASCLAELGAAA